MDPLRGRTAIEVAPLWLPAAELVLDAAPEIRAGHRVLHLDAGGGLLSRLVGSRAPAGARLWVVAPKGAVRPTQLPPGTAVLRASPEAIPLVDSCMDLAMANLTLGTASRLDSTLSEISRVLRPTGTLTATILLDGAFDELFVLLRAVAKEGALAGRIARSRRELPTSARVLEAVDEADLEAEVWGVQEHSLILGTGAAAIADPVVRGGLIPEIIGQDRDASPDERTLRALAKAIDDTSPGRFFLTVRLAVLRARRRR